MGKITVKDFIEKYNKSQSKDIKQMYVKSHVVTEYVPYAMKAFYANNLIKSTCTATLPSGEKDADGKDVMRTTYKINSVTRYCLMCKTILDVYTDIETQSIKTGNDYVLWMNQFDELNKLGLLDEILNAIPKREMDEFNTIIKLTNDDFIANHFETRAWIEDMVGKILTLGNALVTTANDKENLAKIAKAFANTTTSDLSSIAKAAHDKVEKISK